MRKTKSKTEQAVNPIKAKYGRKIGRNDSCPCGSGKKFKDCCLGKIKK